MQTTSANTTAQTQHIDAMRQAAWDAMKPRIEGDLCRLHGRLFRILATFPEDDTAAANDYMNQHKHAAVLGITKERIVVLADVRDAGTGDTR